ncbi:hypothetical protein JNO48_07130 [Clostridiales bacterium]|nr:hypothetical protein JNO48_07130 [Clostridiales bacterium]
MKKAGAALLLALALCIVVCAALADNAQITYVPASIVIDGEIDEAWNQAESISLDKVFNVKTSYSSGITLTPQEEAQTNVSLRTLWNGSVVYLLIDVSDDYIRDEDKVTIGLDLMNDKLPLTEEDDAVININPNSGAATVSWGGLDTPKYQRLTGTSVKKKIDNEGKTVGYTVELGFFISDFAFKGGESLGFDFSVLNYGAHVYSGTTNEFLIYHADNDFSSGDNKCNVYGTVSLETPTEEQWAQRPMDKSLLNSRIGMAEALPHGIWEDETALADALAAAKAVYADDTADRDKVDNATAALQAAIDNMRHVDAVSGHNLPDLQDTPVLNNLPDPFTFLNGDGVTSGNWADRAEEIKAMVQYYEYGFMPDDPDEVTASYNPATGIITINVTVGEVTKSFNTNLFLPSGTKEFFEDGKIPVVVNYSTSNNTNISSAGYAQVGISYTDLAMDINDHIGLFYDLYPYDAEQYADRGTMIAWAWGASRALDALEYLDTHDETLKGKLDLSRIGVTGASRLGKTALVAGLMDERFGVTAPQESGSGGAGTYRYVSYSTEEFPLQYSWADSPASGSEVLPHRPRNQGYQHNQMLYYALDDRWFGDDYPDTSMGARLPYDKNLMLAALAPRGVYVICSNNDDANNPYGDSVSYEGARPVFRALGVEDNLALDVNMKNRGHHTSSDQFQRLMEYMNWYFYGIEMSEETKTKLHTNPFKDEGAYARYGGLETMMENYSGFHYVITFDPGEGSGTMDNAYVVAGEKYTLPENGFTAPEYKEFAGWDAGSPFDEIEVDGDTAVTALWQDIPNTYTFITGGAGTWTRGCGKNMEFTVKGSPNDTITFDLFGGISMDRKPVPAGSYTATRGSVNISVSAEYLDSLEDGSHTLSVKIGESTAETTFTVASPAPATPTDLGPVVTDPPATPTDLEPTETDKPTMTDPPAATDKPTVTDPPAATDKPTVTDPPATTDKPTVTDPPAATDKPTVTDPPAATDKPTVTDPPAATDKPMVTDPPAATDKPTVTDPPAATDKPAVTDPPAATDKPTVTDPPAVTDKPTITDPPAATDKPTVTDPPAVTDKPTVTEKPAVTDKPAPTSKPVSPDSGSYDFRFSFTVRWDADPAESIDWVLYNADGSVAHKKFNKKVSGSEWRYEAWFSTAGDYYIVENVPAGYKVRYENTGTHAGVTDRCYNGGTVINYKVPKTGDPADPLIWACVAALGLAALFLMWRLLKESKDDR